MLLLSDIANRTTINMAYLYEIAADFFSKHRSISRIIASHHSRMKLETNTFIHILTVSQLITLERNTSIRVPVKRRRYRHFKFNNNNQKRTCDVSGLAGCPWAAAIAYYQATRMIVCHTKVCPPSHKKIGLSVFR